jgi:hypothetical protein
MSAAGAIASKANNSKLPAWVTRERITLYSLIVLTIDLSYFFLRFVGAYTFKITNFIALGWDFAVFWSASYLTLHRGAVSAFNVALIEQLAAPLQQDMRGLFPTPWVYPPTFLLLVRPLALLPYYASYVIFVMVGLAFGAFMYTRMLKPTLVVWLPALAFPAVWIALMAGQNSFVTFGLAAGGLIFLDKRPWLAGIFIGLLAIKPQLGAIFPLVLILGRHWRALASACVTATTFCVLSGVILGFETYGQFFAALPWFTHFVVAHAGSWPGGMPTGFGLARHFGLSSFTAYVIQAILATPAVALVIYLTLTKARLELRAAAIAVATLLAQPYLLHYDLIWLALPIVFLVSDGLRHGWKKGEIPVLIVAWLAPIVFYVPTKLELAQYTPIVVIAILVLIFRRCRNVPAELVVGHELGVSI